MEFIEKVKEELKKQGITRIELSRNTEIANSSIKNWENGKQPSLDKALKIAKYLNFSIDELNGIDVKNDNKIQAAYNAADPGTQAAIRKLLDIKEQEENQELFTSKIG